MSAKWRIEIDALEVGQPDEYKNSIFHARVTFDHFQDGAWMPSTGWGDFQVRSMLRGIPCGFTDKPPKDWTSTRLDWLKNTAPGVWEFRTVTPFTD